MSPIKSRKHALGFTTGTSRPAPGTSLTAALFTSLALGAVLPAHAQSTGGPSTDDADQRKTTTLDKVEVQGERERQYSGEVSSPKFTRPLVDTTQTVNVIGADLFTEQGATTLTDVLRNSPGVGTFYVGENGNTATGDTIYMRGFDSSSSIYVDGVRDLGSISRDVFNIQQVEVTKGPAGSDYGRSAPTGSINLASKRAGLVDGNSASVSYGSADQRRLTADFNKALSASSAFRINLMAQDSGVPGRDMVENRRWGIAPSFAFGLDGATRVYLNLLHVDQDNVPDGGVPTIGLPGYSSPDLNPANRPQIAAAPRVDSSNFYGTTSDYDDVTADMATLIVEHALNDGVSLYNTTRWGRTSQDYLLTAWRATSTNLKTPDINDITTWTVTRDLPTFKDQRNTILTNQTNLSANFATGGIEHDLTTGIELSREELDATGWATVPGTAWPAAILYNPNPDVSGLQWARNGADRDGRTDTAAAYLFDTLKLNEQWQLNAGLRVDHYRTEFKSRVACTANANNCAGQPVGTVVPGVDARVSDTLFNWKLGVLFKPTQHGSVYANYAISQQPPGGAALELSGADSNANNPIYDPQKSRTAEIGTKWNLAGERLLLTAAAYETRVDNEVVQDTDLKYYQNGSKRVRGVELSAVGSITQAWSVSAGFTTMDAKVLDGPAVSQDGTLVLSYTPDKAFTAWTTYVFPSGLTIGGGARYSGEMKRGRDGALGTPAFVEDYWVFDAVASYPVNDSLTLRLNANNVFDEAYVAGINKSGYRYSPGAPRNFLLTATFRF